MDTENKVQDKPPVANTVAQKASEPTFDNGPSIVGRKDRKTGWILAIVLLLIVAAGGVGFGVWAYMDGNTQKEQLSAQVNDLQEQNSELQEQLASGSNTGTGMSGGIEGETINTADYIYIGEWGIKIKVPEDLNQVSYLFDSRASESDVEYLYINGVAGEYETVPSFVNTSTQEYWLGVLDRYPSGGAEEIPAGMRGDYVTTIAGYEYYYGHPQNVTTDGDEQELELKTMDAIQDMLTNAENYSAI